MKTMENQIENTGSQVDSQSTFKSEEDFPQTSQEAQSDSEIAENLLSQNKEIVNQLEEELMEEETETQDGKTTGNKSDTEESENLGDWSDEEERQNMEEEGSDCEAEERETTEGPSQEDILGTGYSPFAFPVTKANKSTALEWSKIGYWLELKLVLSAQSRHQFLEHFIVHNA